MKQLHHILTLGSKVGIHLLHLNKEEQTWHEYEGTYVCVEQLHKLIEKQEKWDIAICRRG